MLQQHCRFWDRDNDGQIYPHDTYVGLRDLGFNILFSLWMAVVIHSGLSYPTRLAHSWIPDPLFRVFIDSIHKAKVRLKKNWLKGFLLKGFIVFFFTFI